MMRQSSTDEILMPTYAPAPVTFVRGEGSWLYDDAGRRYLDMLCGLAVTSLGHAHPAVAAAVAEQARTLLHVSNLFRTRTGPEVARVLDGLVGGGGQVFFASSGAEANECAIKLCRRFGAGERFGIVAAAGGFHGRTLGALAATGQPAKQEPFRPLPGGFTHVAWGDAAALEGAVGPETVAVMLEPIQGEGGINPAPPGYLAAARALCDRHGLLLVIDEVQTGLGRTGDWFGFQHEGIAPDVVTVAKALGNGMPISACWARSEVAAAFRPGDHAATFGGQPLAAAAAAATLAVMQDEDVPARARRAGGLLAEGLAQLPGVVEVRGRGLLLGARLGPSAAGRPSPPAQEVAAAALQRGLVVNAIGAEVLRLAPSLLVSDEEIDYGLSLLGAALRSVA